MTITITRLKIKHTHCTGVLYIYASFCETRSKDIVERADFSLVDLDTHKGFGDLCCCKPLVAT